jgi:hypothetical protein
VQSGERIGITPDGPKGPREDVQDGVLYLAQKTGAPIVPVAYGAKRCWIFNSWDRFMLPQPFNRIAMAYGKPIYIGAQDNLERRAVELKEALIQVTNEVDRAVGRL